MNIGSNVRALLAGLILIPPPPPAPIPPAVPGFFQSNPDKVLWSCDFEGTRCGMDEQSKVEPKHRSLFVDVARSGNYGLALVTEPGDSGVHGSGAWERDDLELAPSPEYCNEGQEEWWAVSVLFPDEYSPPSLGTVMDFHHNNDAGNANFHVVSSQGELWFDGFGGDQKHPTEYYADIGPVLRNIWYDFVYHVKWSSAGDGSMTAWVNGNRILDYSGPTLYKGISCYLKLANYHEPDGNPSVIIYDRVMRGTSANAVALTPLE